MSHMFRKSHSGSSWGAGILGLITGAAITYYLYGTDAGEEKRKKLGKYAQKLKDRVGDAKDSVVEYTDEKKEDVTKLAGRMKNHLKEMKDDIGETLG